MKYFTLLLAVTLWALPTHGAVVTKEHVYMDGDTALTSYMAWDHALIKSKATRLPGVLIVHQWMGVTDYERRRARELAQLGYFVCVIDIYGTDFKPTNMQEAGKASSTFKNDRKLFRKRLNLGLKHFVDCALVDASRIAAIGYCFGGTGVLELARSGADVAGVVSFHGGLDSPTPEDGKNIRSKVLVLHGADDPFVSREGIDAMKKEFNDAKVDWQMIEYSGAVHSFTQPMAGDDPKRGAAYNEKADKRSWQHMRAFFSEVLGPVRQVPGRLDKDDALPSKKN
ncbi:MAG: dienelactone hydrolase family protein [Phycisphaeraceae bacterium]